jgi:Tfp pilus assembly protein PilV
MLDPSSLHSLSQRSRRLSGARGFTLVEVACAAFVLLFAIASSIVALQVGFRSLDYARGLTLASQIIQSEMENIRMRPVDQIPSVAGTSTHPGGFTVTRSVAAVPTTPNQPRMYDITLTIEWVTVDRITHRRSTSTQYSENGLNDFFGTDPRRLL